MENTFIAMRIEEIANRLQTSKRVEETIRFFFHQLIAFFANGFSVV